MTIGPTQKSQYITDSDASPRVADTAGKGGPYDMLVADGWITAAAADAAGTIYRMVRLPSYAIVKQIVFESEAQGAGKVQLGASYADAAIDLAGGSTNSGVVISANFFFTDVDIASAVKPVDKTADGSYTMDKRVQPLWQALGLSVDPGGKIDLVLTVHTTDITTGTGKIGLRVGYVAP